MALVAVAKHEMQDWSIRAAYPLCCVATLGRLEDRYLMILMDRHLHLGDAFSSEFLGLGRYPLSINHPQKQALLKYP